MPSLATSDQLHLLPVITNAVAHDKNSPLQALIGLVQVDWPAGTEAKADRLFNKLYECVDPTATTPHQTFGPRVIESVVKTCLMGVGGVFVGYLGTATTFRVLQ